MLSITRKTASIVAAVFCLSGPALAVDHEILIVDGAYFPPLVYATIGDNLVFVNNSSDSHEVKAGDDTWTSGIIPIEGTFVLPIEPDTTLSFTATADTEGTSDGDGDILLEQVGEVILGADPGTVQSDS